MIPKDQSIPDVAQDTILIVYTAAKVNGGKMRGPNRGQNPHPWRNLEHWRRLTMYPRPEPTRMKNK
jgi:hypothetical protein